MDKGNSNFFVKFLKENKGNNNHEKKDLDRILKICELGDPNQQMLKLFQQTVYNIQLGDSHRIISALFRQDDSLEYKTLLPAQHWLI